MKEDDDDSVVHETNPERLLVKQLQKCNAAESSFINELTGCFFSWGCIVQPCYTHISLQTLEKDKTFPTSSNQQIRNIAPGGSHISIQTDLNEPKWKVTNVFKRTEEKSHCCLVSKATDARAFLQDKVHRVLLHKVHFKRGNENKKHGTPKSKKTK